MQPPISADVSRQEEQVEKDFRKTVLFFLAFTTLALIAVVLHQVANFVIATAILWAFGCMAVGGAVGFLFGVPKVLQATETQKKEQGEKKPDSDAESNKSKEEKQDSAYDQQVNTNLTEISDWLTKIIVGVGLVELKQVPGFIKQVSMPLAERLSPATPQIAVATGITVCFVVIGFLFGYLCTRMFLAGAFAIADRSTRGGFRKQFEIVAFQQTQNTQGIADIAKTLAVKMLVDPVTPDRQPGGAEQAVIALAAKTAEATSEKERSYNEWYILSSQALSAEQYPEAVRCAEKALLKRDVPSSARWQIYNILGLAHHYQQPGNWKKGDSRAWYDKALENYERAIIEANTLGEKLLTQTNLAFVYLDAEEYDKAEALTSSVLGQQNGAGAAGLKVFDLTRIAAAAAAVMQGKLKEGTDLLNAAKDLAQFEYIFANREISQQIINTFINLPALSTSVRGLLSRFAIK